jgi:hypothetical protein
MKSVLFLILFSLFACTGKQSLNEAIKESAYSLKVSGNETNLALQLNMDHFEHVAPYVEVVFDGKYRGIYDVYESIFLPYKAGELVLIFKDELLDTVSGSHIYQIHLNKKLETLDQDHYYPH